MTVSTATLTPSVEHLALGAGEDAEPTPLFSRPSTDRMNSTEAAEFRGLYAEREAQLAEKFAAEKHLDDIYGRGSNTTREAIQRAAQPNYRHWQDHISAAAACSNPIRLSGQIQLVDTTTGEILSTRHTADMPDGVIYKACGNRRASQCASCAELYRQDCYQLIKSGLVGGKGTPATIRNHPAVFATFTAPSFGLVHTIRKAKTGKPKPCRARRKDHRDRCPHGRPQYCFAHHSDGDPILGQPLCRDCYDYPAHVVWHLFASKELWRRTLQTANRLLRHHGADKDLKLSYGKVVEYQTRAAIHFHAIIRADIIRPADPTDPESTEQILPPPGHVTTTLIEDVLREAVAATGYQTPEHPQRNQGWGLTWGQQFDVRPLIHGYAGTDDITAEQVAGYIAKYATKTTEATGTTAKRLTTHTIDVYANPTGSHTQRLIHAAWQLGTNLDQIWHPKKKQFQEHPYRPLTRWAHQYGYGGHYLTKSRKYATTFTQLRAARQTFKRPPQTLITPTGVTPPEQIQHITALHYTATGWKTNGDQLLANTAAAQAREWRELSKWEREREVINWRRNDDINTSKYVGITE